MSGLLINEARSLAQLQADMKLDY